MKKFLKNSRILLALTHDIGAACMAWFSAYLLRFNFDIPHEYFSAMFSNLWFVLIIEVVVFLRFCPYLGAWRFASVSDFKRIIISVFLSTAIIGLVVYLGGIDLWVPRSVIILNFILLILLIAGSRLLYRALKEHHLIGNNAQQGTSIIVIGAGQIAASLVKELQQSKEWKVVGLLDDDKSIHNREIYGVRVLGNIENLSKVASNYQIRHVIIAMHSANYQMRRKAINYASELGLEALTVPSIDDIINGRLNISQIRRVNLEDLLGRDVVNLDNSGLQDLICKNNVLVTGAAGSIGSELCRQIIKFKPKYLLCLDMSEYALYQLQQELSSKKYEIKFVFIICDVKNDARLNKILLKYKPNVVFHAAAYKHVPLMENENVVEAFDNNVFGTYTLARACKKANIDKFVLVSTDKAVNPTNIMGATKRLAEMICQGLQEKIGTQFVIVRFGNVLGSSGSVIPKFREQIDRGGPITVTHPEIKRYFMSIPEASQLVMQAGLMGVGGEIFVLDMGDPVRIVDLAKDMIKLSGLTEDEIKIEFSGLRPGEKLYEELLAEDETTLPTSHEKLRIASATQVDKFWINDMLEWERTILTKDEKTVKVELKKWVKEYTPYLQKKTRSLKSH